MKEFKKIEFFLYNYENLDDMIKKVENEYIDFISGSVATWLKSRKNEQNTMEDEVICMIEDKRICKYRKWQAFLKEMFAFFYEDYPGLYKFITLKYINKKDKSYIKNKFRMNDEEFKRVRKTIICWLWINAIEEKII